MLGYWLKNRLVFDALLCILLVLLLSFAFICPIYTNYAESALLSAPYENESIDFDIPSPSEAQISELEAMSFIESVFPYYFTRINISFGEKQRETNLLMYEPRRSVELTMYSEKTMIERLESRPENPMYIDYIFAKESGVGIGDTLSLTLGGKIIDFTVYQINETNSYYKGGAVMVEWDGAQKDAVTASSPSVRYSGALIGAKDYGAARRYFNEDYRALGKLKDESEFSSAEAYRSHYETIVGTSCRNEITDFTVKRTDASAASRSLSGQNAAHLVFLVLVPVIVVGAYNILLWLRGAERGYFLQRKVSGDTSVRSYYLISSAAVSAIIILGVVIAALVIPGVIGEFVPAGDASLSTWIAIAAALLTSVVGFVENIILEKMIKD